MCKCGVNSTVFSDEIAKLFKIRLTTNTFYISILGVMWLSIHCCRQTYVLVDEWKTNLMLLVILFHLLCAQHISDINTSIFRSLRLCWWITTSVILFSVRCVLEFLLRLIFCGVRFAGWSTSASTCKTNTTKYQPQQKLQHTTNWEQDDRCGNSSTKSQAPEDGYINVRNMLSA